MTKKVNGTTTKTSAISSAIVTKRLLPAMTDFSMQWLVRLLALFSVVAMAVIFIFVIGRSMPVLKESGIRFWTEATFDQQITNAYNAEAGKPVYEFGMLGLLAGTVFSTLFALVLAIPIGIGAASVLNEYAPQWLKVPSVAIVRLLASIPSIVYGLVGLTVVVPTIEKWFVTVDMQIAFLDQFQMTGRSLLSSAIVLAIMIVPMIVSLSMDAMRSVPDSLREVGCAMGMAPWRITYKIVLPASKSGIIAGIILAIGRGIGEAVAVSMVCGGIGLVPDVKNGVGFILTPILTLASAIINKSEAISVPSIESALFACGAVLLTIGAILSLISRQVFRFIRKKEGLDA